MKKRLSREWQYFKIDAGVFFSWDWRKRSLASKLNVLFLMPLNFCFFWIVVLLPYLITVTFVFMGIGVFNEAKWPIKTGD